MCFKRFDKLLISTTFHRYASHWIPELRGLGSLLIKSKIQFTEKEFLSTGIHNNNNCVIVLDNSFGKHKNSQLAKSNSTPIQSHRTVVIFILK